MNALPASPHPLDLELFTRLDGVTVIGPWKPLLACALLRLAERDAVDLAILSHFTTFARTHRTALATLKDRWDGTPLLLDERNLEKHPTALTILMGFQKPHEFPAIDILLCLLLDLALGQQAGDQRHTADLSQMLRRCIRDGESSGLVVILKDAKTIPQVLLYGDQHKESGSSTHGPFERAWRPWLRNRLIYLMGRDQRALRRALAPPALAPSMDAPELTLRSGDLDEADDTQEVAVSSTVPLEDGDTERTPRAEFARAHATALVRASQGDLLAPPDHLVPEETIISLARTSLLRAEALVAQGRFRESEPFVALSFAIATGLRASDLADVCWNEAAASRPTVSPSHCILMRPIVTAPQAVVPSPRLSSWLSPRTEHLAWPLPPRLHRLLLQLAQGTSTNGSTVLPWLGSAVQTPYALREVINILQPGLALGSSVLRQALAASLARSQGPDVAQLALGDTFSMSAASTYYSAPQQIDLITAVRALHLAWFGESSSPGAHDPRGAFGSRLVLTDEAARRWPASLRHRRRALVHRKGCSTRDRWIAYRNYLASALCAATGHRPVDAIGQIHLDDVIPEYGLIILHDKMLDPLRKVRVAATGSRWTTALRQFLDQLIAITAASDAPDAAVLAAAILRSEAPLFCVPGDDGPTMFTAADLRLTMPEPLQATTNHYRHRLNQQLQNRRVDPELRFAQLGWVVSPAHATADMSPQSARDLADELGVILDDILLADGWFTASQRISPWNWDGVPMRPMRDWEAVARGHEADHRNEILRLRQHLHERGRLTELDVLPRLAKGIREFLPSLRLDEATRRLHRAPTYPAKDPVLITDDLCTLICDRVRQQDVRPTEVFEAAVTRILLHRLVSKSHREGLTTGALPRRPIFRLTAEPSPFLPGSGLAVRHAELMRQTMLNRALESRPHDQGTLTLLAVVLFSPYRHLDWATAAVNAAAEAVRGQQPGDCLRVPASLDRKSFPMIFGGVAALLLARRGMNAPKSHAPSLESLVKWLLARLPSELIPTNQDTVLQALVSTSRAAGRLELSGPERLLMLGTVALTSMPVQRCLAADDQWPVHTRDDAPNTLERSTAPVYVMDRVRDAAASLPTNSGHYRELTALLNPEILARERDTSSDGHRGWHGDIDRKLVSLRSTTGPHSTLGLVIGFALHRLRFGGVKVRNLQHRTLHNEVTLFANPLIKVVGTRSLLQMDVDTLFVVYLAILQVKPSSARPSTAEALRTFHRYLEEQHQVDSVPFGELSSFAGPRVSRVNAGLLTDAEVDEVFRLLERDLRDERERVDASPDFVRLAELKLIFFLLLEASGSRPASIHGLVLSDLCLFGEGRDFIHLHKTGSYSSVKTTASIGFVPLEGALWTRARRWVYEWVERERLALVTDRFCRTPVFADSTGSSRRFSRDHLDSRIGELIRWMTDENKSRPYWLRKRRIMARHRAANAGRPARARDVQAALCASGQAQIITPLASYISDPAIAVSHSLASGRHISRAEILSSSGLAAAPLDLAWLRRGGADSENRFAVVFDRLPFAAAAIPERRYGTPPTHRRQLGLLPAHIDHFARSLQRHAHTDQAALQAGLSPLQVERLQLLASELVAARGQVPWQLASLLHPRAVMRAPRRLQGTENMLRIMDFPPTPELLTLADTWVNRGHASRLIEDTTALPLIHANELVAARVVLTAMNIDPNCIALHEGGLIHTLQIHRPNAADRTDPSDDRRTLAATFFWILAMVWLQHRLK